MIKLSNILTHFLKPDEKNFDLISEKQKKLHEKILDSSNDVDSPRMKIDPMYKYGEKLEKEFLPFDGLADEVIYDKVSKAFEGVIKFHHPNTLFNITPPASLDAIAVSTVTNLYNPNILWDINSGNMVLFERYVVKYLCDLAGFNYKTADGISCFGGKATMIYAIKQGLENINKNVNDNGIKDEYVVITSKVCHYTIESVCDLLGLGRNSCIRVSCDNSENMRLDEFERILDKCIVDGKKIACIILAGGGTLDLNVDDIPNAIEIVKKICLKHNLQYAPHIHLDSVIGWAWLFYKDYDFHKNELMIGAQALNKLMSVSQKIRNINLVGSFGVDLHKMGFCPYSSSFFVAKKSLGNQDKFNQSYGDNQVYTYSIENSRSGTGILSAWVTLNQLGIRGFREYLAYIMEVSEYLREKISLKYSNDFQTINDFSSGPCIMLKPHYKDQNTDFYKLLSDDQSLRNNYNNYCERFYKYAFYKLSKEGQNYPLIGFLSNYRRRTIGSDLSALRLFPMSLFLDEDICDKILDSLLKMKKEFEYSYLHSSESDTISIHEHQPR